MTTRQKSTIEEVLKQFDGMKDVLDAFSLKTKSLIEASLQDVGIRYQSVQARVKSRKKLQEKYLGPDKNYQKLQDITDLAGLRVITYYEDDIDRAAEIVKREFKIDSGNSVDKRVTDPDRFGYSALNFVCTHLEKRTTDVEYKKFAGITCEIQVTSILKHAWSEIEHEWYDLKESYPPEIKRDFYRLAAVFELVDSKFVDLRKARAQYERSVTLRVEAMAPNVLIDAVSLKPYLEQEPLVAQLNMAIGIAFSATLDLTDPSDRALGITANLLKPVNLNTLEELSTAIKKYMKAVPEYLRRCIRDGIWPAPATRQRYNKSSSLNHLGIFMLCLQGVEALTSYYKSLGAEPQWDVARQVAIAKEVVTKF